jgi:hypothetical protein
MLLTLVPDPLRWPVGDPHADSSKTSLELSFRAGVTFKKWAELFRKMPKAGRTAHQTKIRLLSKRQPRCVGAEAFRAGRAGCQQDPKPALPTE